MVILPLYSLALGYNEAFYGTMVAAAGYIQSFAFFPAGTISDRKGRGSSILIGGLISGLCYILLPLAIEAMTILTIYALTGIGIGFARNSIDSLVADYTKFGDERTQSYGYTYAIAILAASIAPLLGGFILDENAFPIIEQTMTRYAFIFFFLGGISFITGFLGLVTENWLKRNQPIESTDTIISVDTTSLKDDTKTAILFGTSDVLVGFSNGMVIPYLLPWLYATFQPDPLVLGTIPAIANLILAMGAVVVGLTSEKIGNLKMIGILYSLTPLLTFGLVYAPSFFLAAIFYISRNTIANMTTPPRNSLIMGEISMERRARSLGLARSMWSFPRETGVLFSALLLSIGIFGDIISYGKMIFPIILLLYPVGMIPLYIAIRRNKDITSLNI
jgi:hypothetical protein